MFAGRPRIAEVGRSGGPETQYGTDHPLRNSDVFRTVLIVKANVSNSTRKRPYFGRSELRY
jgi:hypothetical protein